MTGMEKNGLTAFCHWRKGTQEQWTGIYIPMASWFSKTAAKAGSGGMEDARFCTARIPAGAMPAGYVPPGEYAALDTPGGKWSLQPGDIIVRGRPALQPEQAHEILSLPDEHFVVTAVYDNRRGPRLLHHLKVEGQ